MKRVATVVILAVAAFVAVRILAPTEDLVVVAPTAEATDHPEGSTVRRLKAEVVSERPHDPMAFTQGLEMRDGLLYESTGGHGTSTVRGVDPETGAVVLSRELPEALFGEGLTIVENRLVQLTWRSGEALLWNVDTLERERSFRYDGEGWGLCFDGRRLVMSDGSDVLTLRDPDTFDVLGRVRVTLDGRAVSYLNELECVDGAVWANIWQADEIVRIDPFSGRVDTVVDASGLLSAEERSGAGVLNGIARDPESGNWLLTGKLWPTLFETRFVEE